MIGSNYDDWQVLGPAGTYSRCSPNLLLVLSELRRRWPAMTNLGCFGRRPIRGGGAPSSHSFGAAVDVGYPSTDDELVGAHIAPWLVARSDELHIGAIHDYRRCRIWHAGRTGNIDDACSHWWKAQRPSSVTGMGQVWANHLHLEVTADGFHDERPVSERWTE